MVNIEKDSRWNNTYFTVNGKSIGDTSAHSFHFFLDRDSLNIYSDDTEHSFTLEEIGELVDFLREHDNKRKETLRKLAGF